MRLFIRSSFFLIIFSVLTTLYFTKSATAQQEGAGNYISEIDGKTYTLNYEDKSRKRPNDDSIGRRYILQCDNRQENLIQKLINAPSHYVNGQLTSAGFQVCQNTTPDGYVVEPGEPGYVIPQLLRTACAEPPSNPLYQRRDQRVCDLIELEKEGIAAGKNIPPNPISGGQCVNAKGRKGTLPVLIPFSNPESGKASLEPAPCGTTFETYNPPKIACGEDGLEPGVWAPVRSDGAVFYPFVSDCLTSAPGGFTFACDLQPSGAPCGTPPANIKMVFLNPKDPVIRAGALSPSTRHIRRQVDSHPRYAQFRNQFTSLDEEYSEVEDPDGPASRYDFATGIYTNDQGKQFIDGIPVTGITSPGGPGDSPAQAELARARAARQELEQQLNNAQATLSEVEEAKGAAERQLAAAQDALASATAALQAAEQAVQQETEKQAADLAIAEQAVQDAQQQLELVNTEVMTADSALVALQDQIANAEAKLASLKARQDEGVRILNDAKAKVAQLTGMSFVGDIQDSTVDAGTGSGSLPLKPGRRITPAVVAVSGGSGQQCSPTNAIQGSIPLRIICPGATSAEPFRGVLDIVEGSPSEQRPVFAIKIKTGPSWDPKWRTRITLHPDRPAIDPANRGRPVTAEIYLGFGVQPGETKFYPIKAEGRFVLIKSIDGAVDIAELEIIEGCRQPDGTINRCPGRGPVRRAAIE